MIEDQIITGIVAILVAIIGWFSGSLVEKRRHNNDIEFFFLTQKLNAYNIFLADLRETSIFTGKMISKHDFLGDNSKCSELRDQLYSFSCKLWTDSSNPYILSDEDIGKCITEVNNCIAKIECALIVCSNNESAGLVDCSSAHIDMMEKIRKCERAISKKYDSCFVNYSI